MSWCSVLGCKEDKRSGRGAFKFPGIKEVDLRERWIKFSGQLSDWKPHKQALICGVHFKESDFVNAPKGKAKKKILIFGAIPCLKDSISIHDPLDEQLYEAGENDLIKQIAEMTCRICLVENPDAHVSLKSYYKDQTVAQIYSYCTSIDIDLKENLPTIICDSCFIKLEASKELKESCVKSDSILRRSLFKSTMVNMKHEEEVVTNGLQIKVEPLEVLTMDSHDVEMEMEREIENDDASDIVLDSPKKFKIIEEKVTRRTAKINKHPKSTPNLKTNNERDLLLDIKCDDCGRMFDESSWFVNHRCNVAKKTCTICFSKFKERSEFFQHFKDAHFSDRECKHCNLVLKSARALHEHLRIHIHKNNYMCEFCSKVFPKQRILDSHRVQHIQHYQCDLCGIVVSCRSSMSTHFTNVHTITKNIPCTKCPQIFKRKLSYDLHQVRHHGITAPVSCPTCNKKYIHVSQVNAHIKNIHLKIRPEQSSYNQKCTKCFKVFKHQSSLFKHMKNHDLAHAITKKGRLHILRHECTHCPKKFSRRQILIEHLRVHTGERPHQCQKCLMCFKIARTLRGHLIKIHHEVNPSVSTKPNLPPGNTSKTPAS